MIFGIVDIGSHTLRLAIYERREGADFLLAKTKFALSLAGYLKNNVMAQEGILALLSHLRDFSKFLSAFKIAKIYAFATAALRMSENKGEILRRIAEETGFAVQILSGEEEASLAFRGATKDSPVNSGVLIDIGGGSSEIVKFEKSEITEEYSLPIGVVSFSKKYGGEFFPAPFARGKIKEATLKAVKDAKVNFSANSALALGGAAKGAKLLLDRDANSPITKEELDSLLKRFSGELTDNDKSLLLRKASDRAPILITGFLMLSAFMEALGAENFYYMSGGVREGYIDRYVK